MSTTNNKHYYQIKYTYKHYHYDETHHMPRHEYELYKKVLWWKKFISINYHPVPNVPIIKEVMQ